LRFEQEEKQRKANELKERREGIARNKKLRQAQEQVEIRSIKSIKTGTPNIRKDLATSMVNELFSATPGVQPQNPYELIRPVIMRITYRCSSNREWSFIDIETEQKQNKWGDWDTDTSSLKSHIIKKCVE
jgi:hypothetical protein